MKIFRCKECDAYTGYVKIIAPIVLRAKVDDKGNFHPDPPDPPAYELIARHKVIDISLWCEECGEDNALELIELDRCPHQWGRAFFSNNGHVRRCRLCNLVQKAQTKIEWPEESS